MLPDLRQSQVGPFAPIVAASLWLPVVHPPVITRECNVTFLGFAVNFAQDSCISSNFGRHTSVMGDSAAPARKQTYKRPVPPTGAPEQKTAHKRHNNTSPANDRVGESCSCCSILLRCRGGGHGGQVLGPLFGDQEGPHCRLCHLLSNLDSQTLIAS